MNRVRGQRMLNDEHARAAGLNRIAEPFRWVVRFGVLGIGVGHYDVGVLKGLRAIGLGGHSDRGVVRIDDVPAEHIGGPELLVVHGLHAEIDLGHTRGFDHVQPHFVLEDPDRPRGLGLPEKHVVVVLDGLDVGNAGQNRLGASAVARVVVNLDAADGDLEVRSQEVLV